MTSAGREAVRETRRKIKNERATEGDWEGKTEVDNDRKAQGQRDMTQTQNDRKAVNE